jgi:hypothetical protein
MALCCCHKNNHSAKKFDKLILFLDSINQPESEKFFVRCATGGPGDYLFKSEVPDGLVSIRKINYIKMIGDLKDPVAFLVVYKGFESSMLVIVKGKSRKDLNGVASIRISKQIEDRVFLLRRRSG